MPYLEGWDFRGMAEDGGKDMNTERGILFNAESKLDCPREKFGVVL